MGPFEAAPLLQRVVSLKGCATALLLHSPLLRPVLGPSYPPQSLAITKREKKKKKEAKKTLGRP